MGPLSWTLLRSLSSRKETVQKLARLHVLQKLLVAPGHTTSDKKLLGGGHRY